MKNAGPSLHGPVMLPATFMLCPVIPCVMGKAPVPIVAWICAVDVGEEPTAVSVKYVPFGISDLR